MAQTVIGVFDSSTEAQNAVEQLVNSGFSRSNIDVSSRSGSAYGTSSGATNSKDRDGDGDVDFGDKVGNFFSSLFGGGEEASKYSSVASKGCVVTVHAQSMQEAERAADILDQYGSVDVNDRAMKLGYGSSAASTGYTDTTTSGYSDTTSRDMSTSNMGMNTSSLDMDTTSLDMDTTSRDMDTTSRDMDTSRMDMDRDTSFRDRDVLNTDKSIPIIEENLQVGKREVTTGGVRLRSRIIERPVEEHLRLREEHVTVERNPVNRPASAADLANFQEGSIEMTEHAEQAIVNKEARIVEEVRLNKEVTERDEVVRDTVRRTDVDVENLSTTDRLDNDRLDLDNDRTRYDNDRRLDSDDLSRPAGL